MNQEMIVLATGEYGPAKARYLMLATGVILIGLGAYYIFSESYGYSFYFVLTGIANILWSWSLFYPKKSNIPKLIVNDETIIIKPDRFTSTSRMQWRDIAHIKFGMSDMTFLMQNGDSQTFSFLGEPDQVIDQIKVLMSRWQTKKLTEHRVATG